MRASYPAPSLMAPSPAGLHQCRVLLTDDDPLVRMIYVQTLRGRGCQVTEARNGVEAVTLAGTLLPDLVLLDLSMPGMDGWQALETLRADPRTRDLVIVALTASGTASVRERALAAGFDGFVIKPFTPQGLLRELEDAYAQARGRRRPAQPEPPPLQVSMPSPAPVS